MLIPALLLDFQYLTERKDIYRHVLLYINIVILHVCKEIENTK